MSSPGALRARLPPALPSRFYYYACDGVRDEGWGCGHRCVQTLLSAEAEPVPDMPTLMAALGYAEGVYADVGDLLLLLGSLRGWGHTVLQVAVRSEIPSFLDKCERLLHDPANRYTWGILVGGGIMVLLADVDTHTSRLQVFDPHGEPADPTGMGTLPKLGSGGFGWISATDALLGSADPDVAAYMEPDELMIAMNWVVVFFDRAPS
ncbi:hypothetical protein EON67_11680 [archaeon]|nr:MAG: hypothetical protein EON67_11680 [archaeon]